jgi:alkanesulfonate monooxygenase SsuD/methylene tetrahydromethanopterin reductase-like flavin-dependent oxidoreductase (luciferase family)
MKFGIFDHVERLRNIPLDQQYSERLDLLAQADKGEIYGYHVAEHHHSPLSMIPSQAPYLAAVAARTEKLRFGPLVYVLPLYHPVRLVEEICMLDNLSGGRYQIGIGRGAPVGDELSMWGTDPEQTHSLFDETFQILMKGLTQDFLNFKGKHYEFKDLWMEMKPKQTPHPPFWYAGNPVNAAEFGANFIGAGTLASLPSTMARYKEVWERQTETNDPALPHVADPLYGASKRVFIAETDEEAQRRARPAYEVYRDNFVKPLPGGKSRRPTDMVVGANPNRQFPWDATFEEAVGQEQVLVGSPRTIKEYIASYVEESGCNYFVGSFQWGDVTHEEASRSLQLFTLEVMPDFV